MDLGIEVILELFSKEGLKNLFQVSTSKVQVSDNSKRIIALQNDYLKTIDYATNEYSKYWV